MSDFALSWSLSRKRLVDEVEGLDQRQLNWQIHPNCLSIGQMALHVAGVEVSFCSQLSGATLDETGARLKLAATQGVVNDEPFPYSPEEITPELVRKSMAYAESVCGPMIEQASADVREREIKSALGPMISGEGAFARLGFHSGYHQGQAYLIKTAPGFPS